ncbi:MAG: methyltransferase domain-containing protein [Acidimicrobiaceae bacterium]|nr:methyltransferase domain-containing protein [Acidimicrobiaceae bacterium]
MIRTAPGYFERLYRSSDDPWGLATRAYERRKYAITVACLLEERYRSAFEPGCSIGALSEQLATRCDRVLAMDHMAAARDVAVRRLRHLPHVEVVAGVVPEDWPAGPFDLLVLSELCYYFDAGELRRLAERAVSSLEAGATVIAVHWAGKTDYPLTAAETHAALAATPSWQPAVHHADEEFMLDVWRHHP